MVKSKRGGILRVVLTTIVLRSLLILFTLYISSYRNNHIPNYYYTSRIVNLNLDNLPFTNNDVNNNKDNTNNNTKNKNIHKINSKPYLKGPYIHPITTIYNFVDNYNRINHPEDVSNHNNKIDNKLNRRLKWLTGFVSWDGERFLKNVIFHLTYTSEDSCAFFPFFSLLIYWLRNLTVLVLKKLFNFEIKDGLTGVYLILLIGVVLNNLLSIVNNVLIYLLVTKLLQYNLTNNGYYRSLICHTDTFTKSNGDEHFNRSRESQSDNYELYLRRIDKIGCLACFVYNLSPGFIFTTSFYTEPLYSLFYYLTLLIFMKLYNRNNKASTFTSTSDSNTTNNKLSNKKTNYKSNNDEWLVLTAVVLAFISGFVRSNSVLFSILLFFYKLYKCPLVNYIYNRLTNNNNNNNNNNNDISGNNNKEVNKLLLFFNFLGYWILNLLYLFVILTPFFLIQLYGYFLYCNKLNFDEYLLFSKFHHFIYNVFRNPKLVYNIIMTKNGDSVNKDIKAIMDILDMIDMDTYNINNLNLDMDLINMNTSNRDKIKWCSDRFPSIYKHIQNKYWGIELFYTFKSWNNFVNLIYSIPTLVILFMYLFNFTKHYILPNLTNTDNASNNNNNDKYNDNKDKRHISMFTTNLLARLLATINNFEFGLFVHFIITLNSFLLFSHIQIIFRQSLCLIQYIIQFSLMLYDLGVTFNGFLNKTFKNIRNNKDNKKYRDNNNTSNKDNNKSNPTNHSKLNKVFIRFLGHFFLYLYNSVLCFVGIILFSNFIGWT